MVNYLCSCPISFILISNIEYYLRTIFEVALLDGITQTVDVDIPYVVTYLKYGRETLEYQTVKSAKPSEEEWRAFTVSDLRSVFRLLTIGLIASLFVCFIERIFSCTTRRELGV